MPKSVLQIFCRKANRGYTKTLWSIRQPSVRTLTKNDSQLLEVPPCLHKVDLSRDRRLKSYSKSKFWVLDIEYVIKFGACLETQIMLSQGLACYSKIPKQKKGDIDQANFKPSTWIVSGLFPTNKWRWSLTCSSAVIYFHLDTTD